MKLYKIKKECRKYFTLKMIKPAPLEDWKKEGVSIEALEGGRRKGYGFKK